MNTRIKIEGVYDSETLNVLREEGIVDIAFDFRPKSFNFLQRHVLLDILKESYSPRERYSLHFSNESHLMIEKITTDLKEVLSLPKETWSQACYLEFSGNESPQEMDSHGMPFYWHYRIEKNMVSVMNCHFLKGIILDYNLLHQFHENDKIYHFIKTFLSSISSLLQEREGELVLKRNWESNIFPSLYDLLDFSVISLPIDNRLEFSYRNVDTKKMKRELSAVKIHF